MGDGRAVDNSQYSADAGRIDERRQMTAAPIQAVKSPGYEQAKPITVMTPSTPFVCTRKQCNEDQTHAIEGVCGCTDPPG
jgi:hypothetical protein